MREPPPARFAPWVELSSERLGSAVLAANDEFFAPKERLLAAAPPVFDPERYTEAGKWMDGWETRRRREPGNDWAVIRLGLAGILRGALVDTRHFTGNYPEACSIEGAVLVEEPEAWEIAGWQPVLPRTALQGDTVHELEVEGSGPLTHLRLSIYPDGGVARLRIFGEVVPGAVPPDEELDLAALTAGGRVVAASDMHYGNANNLLLPGEPVGMFDGWETRRRRGPGHDWAIVRLGRRGRISRLEVDTSFFKGNAPGSCRVEAADLADGDPDGETPWRTVLKPSATRPHHLHRFDTADSRPATHLRLSIYPDGGVARLRAFGVAAPAGTEGA